jgi:hypothetical protein
VLLRFVDGNNRTHSRKHRLHPLRGIKGKQFVVFLALNSPETVPTFRWSAHWWPPLIRDAIHSIYSRMNSTFLETMSFLLFRSGTVSLPVLLFRLVLSLGGCCPVVASAAWAERMVAEAERQREQREGEQRFLASSSYSLSFRLLFLFLFFLFYLRSRHEACALLSLSLRIRDPFSSETALLFPFS